MAQYFSLRKPFKNNPVNQKKLERASSLLVPILDVKGTTSKLSFQLKVRENTYPSQGFFFFFFSKSKSFPVLTTVGAYKLLGMWESLAFISYCRITLLII